MQQIFILIDWFTVSAIVPQTASGQVSQLTKMFPMTTKTNFMSLTEYLLPIKRFKTFTVSALFEI